MNRREFIRTAAAITIGSTIATPIVAQEPTTETKYQIRELLHWYENGLRQ